MMVFKLLTLISMLRDIVVHCAKRILHAIMIQLQSNHNAIVRPTGTWSVALVAPRLCRQTLADQPSCQSEHVLFALATQLPQIHRSCVLYSMGLCVKWWVSACWPSLSRSAAVRVFVNRGCDSPSPLLDRVAGACTQTNNVVNVSHPKDGKIRQPESGRSQGTLEA